MEERRVVTILFGDVTDSTALASQVDAEDWAEIISGVFPLLIDPVERYGGTVARLMGDAILAFFGAPTAHEDDPQRAILAALDILDGINGYREQVRIDYGLDINLRVGINTGVVVTQEVGSRSGAWEYTALGDAVNVAARMEQTAEPGTIQVTSETYRLALRYFEFEPLGPIAVKGKDEPVETYRVLGRASDSAMQRGIGDFAAPTVGRERELDLLRYRLDELAVGRGGIIALVGEAGLGKSRMLDELRRHWFTSPDHQIDSWIEDQLVSFEVSVPYGLLRRRVARDLGITDDDPPATIQERLTTSITFIDNAEREEFGQAIVQLLGSGHTAEQEANAGAGMAGAEGFRHEVELAIKSLWTSRVERNGQVVYVIDDLHSADPASADLLELAFPDLIDLPLLIILAFRPERESPAWPLHERVMPQLGVSYLTITLAPLDDRNSESLLESMLPGAQFPETFRRTLLERIDGNPLFAEELVRLLIEQQIIQTDPTIDAPSWRLADGVDLTTIAIPATLRALMQERMDRLDPSARQTLQLAAVIGRVFELSELEAIHTESENLPRDLATLEQAMLIHRRRRADRGSYEFHHALTREAVYRSILRRHRRQLHLRTAEALERLHTSQMGEYAGRISMHFAEASDGRAVRYAIEAGDQAFALYAPAEAIELYSRAIDLTERFQLPPVPFQVIRRRGSSYFTLGDFAQARQDFERILALAEDSGNVRDSWQALTDIADLWEGLDYERSGEWRQRALGAAEQIGDQTLIVDSLGRLGNWYTNFERIDEARDALTRALAISREQGDRVNEAHVLDVLGFLEGVSGDLVKARACFEDAIVIFEMLGDQQRLSSALSNIIGTYGVQVADTFVVPAGTSFDDIIAMGERSLSIARSIGWKSGQAYALYHPTALLALNGYFDRALKNGREALEIATEIQHLEWQTVGHGILGDIYLEFLIYEPAIDHLKQSYAYARESGSGYFISNCAAGLVAGYIATGRLDEADQLVMENENDQPARTMGRRRLRCTHAELLLARGEAVQTLDFVHQLYETALNLTRPGDIPRLSLLQGRALAQLGRNEEALELFDETVYGANRLGALPYLWRTQIERGLALQTLGRQNEADGALEEARSIVRQLAEWMADAELRGQFLSHASHLIDAADHTNQRSVSV